jgi:hypothetical protein
MYTNVLVMLGALSAVASATEYKPAPPIFNALDYTTWSKRHSGKSRVGEIYVPFTAEDGSDDFVKMTRLDLVGDARTRGYDHGFLLAEDIVKFVEVDLNKYFMDMVLNLNMIDTTDMPKPLQDIFAAIKVKGALAAPGAFAKAFAWVYESEEEFGPKNLVEEMEGLGEGICAGLGKLRPDCDPAAMTELVKNVNMLPELIRMACTAWGAWGKGTSDGKLVQLRALDFGGGPFANHTIITSNREEGQQAFAAVSFPGFVGVVTGVSQSGVGISEKVWMTYDKRSLQKGSYKGEADIFVLRDILEHSKNKADAEQYLSQVQRTWGMWIGVGDYETQQFDLVGYKQDSAVAYTDVTMPSMTEMPYLENVCYVDKHPQPSHDGVNGTLPTYLTDYYGDLSMENARIGVRHHQTGDVHIASYDFGKKQMIVSIGRINEDGDYGPVGSSDMSVWKAYNRPYIQFDLEEMWQGH